MMKLDRFTELLDAYGAEPRRWPSGERGAAQALLDVSAEARARLAAAAALDALLDQAAAAEAPRDEAAFARLSAEITATAQAPLGTGYRPSDRSIWVKAASLAAAALIGFVVSWTQLVDFGPASIASLSTTTSFDVAEALSW
jgi:hypothetical protein